MGLNHNRDPIATIWSSPYTPTPDRKIWRAPDTSSPLDTLMMAHASSGRRSGVRFLEQGVASTRDQISQLSGERVHITALPATALNYFGVRPPKRDLPLDTIRGDLLHAIVEPVVVPFNAREYVHKDMIVLHLANTAVTRAVSEVPSTPDWEGEYTLPLCLVQQMAFSAPVPEVPVGLRWDMGWR